MIFVLQLQHMPSDKFCLKLTCMHLMNIYAKSERCTQLAFGDIWNLNTKLTSIIALYKNNTEWNLKGSFGHRVLKSRRGPSCKKASVLLVVVYVCEESKATQSVPVQQSISFPPSCYTSIVPKYICYSHDWLGYLATN